MRSRFLDFAHVLIRKPVPTFPGHAPMQREGAMRTALVTGAAGEIGTRLRKLLKGVYPRIRWSDIRPPSDLSR
jgi:hypothetical protein